MGYKEPFLEGSRNVFCQSRTLSEAKGEGGWERSKDFLPRSKQGFFRSAQKKDFSLVLEMTVDPPVPSVGPFPAFRASVRDRLAGGRQRASLSPDFCRRDSLATQMGNRTKNRDVCTWTANRRSRASMSRA